jgi:hypothetical protein
MFTDPVFYAFAVPAVVLLGLSKGGFVGVGTLALPLMALVASPIASAAILLPILIVQDAVGVWAFRQSWDAPVLKAMLPGAALGILLGYLLAALVSADVVLAAVGLLCILFALQRLWAERGGRIVASSDSPPWIGALFGVATGFTSQIAHAGGPPYQMWVMPRRLSRDSFIGTTAIFFAATILDEGARLCGARAVHDNQPVDDHRVDAGRDPLHHGRRQAGPQRLTRTVLHEHLRADDPRRREAVVGRRLGSQVCAILIPPARARCITSPRLADTPIYAPHRMTGGSAAHWSRNDRILRDRDGCLSLRSAFASIWRMRSRVTENCWPTSSSV